MKYKKREIVWQNKRQALRVVFEEDRNIFLEFGYDFNSIIYLKININGLWKDLVKFMNKKKLNQEIDSSTSR